MRVFAALPLPPSAAAALAAGLEPLRKAHPDLRWVNAAGFHVTLHFFGELQTAQVDDLRGALDSPKLRGHVIAARLGGLGQFPPKGSPRVLWASLGQGAEEARGCWNVFHELIDTLGWQPDPRGFTPHVTVARAGREKAGPVDTTDASITSISSIAFDIGEIVLFESIPGKGGATYLPLKRVSFDGRDA